MSRNRKRKNRQYKDRWGDHYWQSAAFNQQTFQMYLDWLMGLAMSRFQWTGLPKTCDERFIEWTLLTQGVCTIAKPKGTDKFYSTQAITDSPPNVYDNYSSWHSFGNGGWRFPVKPSNGVLVWDNMLRRPILSTLEWYARELADIKRCKQINRSHQKKPYLITGPQEKVNDMMQVSKDISGGSWGIVGMTSFDDIDIKAIDTQVDFLGEELNADTINTLNEVCTFLGIKSLPRKSERMVAEEVYAQDEPTTFRALDPLSTRRQAAKELNDRFGLDVSVVWRRDNESENYDIMTSLRKLSDIANGDGGDSDDSAGEMV